MKTENIKINDLQSGSWQASHILRPDLLTLAKSLADFGFLSPLIVRKTDNSIIDGYHRWRIVKDDKHLSKLFTEVPCMVIDCDSIEASLIHLRLNRGRGFLVADRVSAVVKGLVRSKKYSEEDLSQLLSISSDEFDLLIDGTILKRVNYPEHKYSRAWVPIEAPKGATDNVVIEGPPNSDR